MAFNTKCLLTGLKIMILGVALLALPQTSHADESQTPYEMNAQKASIPQNSNTSVKKTIQAQLDAISERDASLAFSYMTDQSHSAYEGAKDFLSDMRFKFGAIYNHVDVEFLHSYENGRTSIQKVKLSDRYSSESAIIVYKLTLQSSGNWLIESFAVIETEEAQPI